MGERKLNFSIFHGDPTASWCDGRGAEDGSIVNVRRVPSWIDDLPIVGLIIESRASEGILFGDRLTGTR